MLFFLLLALPSNATAREDPRPVYTQEENVPADGTRCFCCKIDVHCHSIHSSLKHEGKDSSRRMVEGKWKKYIILDGISTVVNFLLVKAMGFK